MLYKDIGWKYNNIAMIGTPDVPIYLLNYGDGFAIIEGGISAAAPLVLEQLRLYAKSLDKVTHWFLTHSHYDHVGLVNYLIPHLPSVKVYGSEKLCNAFKSQSALRVISELNKTVVSMRGVADEVSALGSIPLDKCRVHEVRDGDIFMLCETSLKVVVTPGHSKCAVTYLLDEPNIAFVSDYLGEFIAYKHWCPLVFYDAVWYINSIKKIRGLCAEEYALAHHGILTGKMAETAPDDALSFLWLFINKIRESVEKGLSKEFIARDISLKYRASTSTFFPLELHYKSMLRNIELLIDVQIDT